ncbi:hypothetical protein [Nocardia farcinica]|uniref:hypothetical protein n=1 Tax=Nocardia farcinica TaxID=37329 RepID=UPI001892D3D2|nr:hypothetical protein [Nocardia farcinica]MBF6251880.1 hypothetical protein [Nocardia farcinica]
MTLVVDWQTYYEAAKKCHDVAASLRAADKPLHDLKNEFSGMAGDANGCRQWGEKYDQVARDTMQACTNLADALTNFGYALYATGYNYGIRARTNPAPDRPTVQPMAIHKVSIPSSIGNNGNGVAKHDDGIAEFYDQLVDKIAEEFGKLPNGDVQKLGKAADEWRKFAENGAIVDAAGEIASIKSLFDKIQDKTNLPPILEKLDTLGSSAKQVSDGSAILAGLVSDYHTSTVAARSSFESEINLAVATAGIAVAGALVFAAVSFGGSFLAGAGAVGAIVLNCVNAIRTAYQSSNLIRVIGLTTAAAGASVVLTHFDAIPNLDDLVTEGGKLGAIIIMKVLIDGNDPFWDLPAAPDNPAPGMTQGAEDYILGKHIKDAANYDHSKGTWPDGTTGEDLDNLAEAAEVSPARGPNKDGNYEREVDAGRPIGSVSEQLGGHVTSRYKVVTDRFGGIITMYPIP